MTDLIQTLTGGKKHVTEVERIVQLPIDDRSPDEDDLSELVETYSERFGKPGREYDLNAAQALALDCLERYNALVGDIGVGWGKSLIALLAPRVLDLDPYECVILHPANTRSSMINEAKKQRRNFDIETRVHLLSYKQLSDKGGRQLLRRARPRLIVADEAHYLRRRSSARTKRILDYYREHPDALFVPMSGTFNNDSIEEFSHLLELALRELSPAPRSWTALQTFKFTLDVDSPLKIARGFHWDEMQPLNNAFGDERKLRKLPVTERKSTLREAFEKRYSSTPGVIITRGQPCDASILFDPVTIDVPEEVEEAIEYVKSRFLLPCGAEVDDPLAKSRAIRQLSCGFYYRWDWDAIGGVDREWLYARREFRKQVRRIQRYGRRRLDTPTLVERAIERGEYEHDDDVMAAYEEWQRHAHKPEPPKETIWLDDFLVDDVIARAHHMARHGRPPLVWYRWEAVAQRLDDKGFEVYFAGQRDPEEASGDEPIAVSIHSARRGENLQQFSSNVVISPSPTGLVWEQMMGRTHRQGQPADEVYCQVYVHTEKFRQSVIDARTDAQFIAQTKNQQPKILFGNWTRDL